MSQINVWNAPIVMYVCVDLSFRFFVSFRWIHFTSIFIFVFLWSFCGIWHRFGVFCVFGFGALWSPDLRNFLFRLFARSGRDTVRYDGIFFGYCLIKLAHFSSFVVSSLLLSNTHITSTVTNCILKCEPIITYTQTKTPTRMQARWWNCVRANTNTQRNFWLVWPVASLSVCGFLSSTQIRVQFDVFVVAVVFNDSRSRRMRIECVCIRICMCEIRFECFAFYSPSRAALTHAFAPHKYDENVLTRRRIYL